MSYNNITAVQLNDIFAQQMDQERKQHKALEEQRLKDMNERYKKNIYNLTLEEIIIGLRNTWFDIIQDLIHFNMSMETFTKDNRMFFIGLSVVIFALLYSLSIGHLV